LTVVAFRPPLQLCGACDVTPSPWSGKLNGSMTHISAVVPGVSGPTLGAQVTFAVNRNDDRNTLTFEGELTYLRVQPAAAAADQWD
jgi:hypothetical protein